jgi:hypothetical protein
LKIHVKLLIAEPVLLPSISPMKYVAWVNKDHRYKHHLFLKLSSLQISQFILIFHKNKSLAEYILLHKLYRILDDRIDFEKYEFQELKKMNDLIQCIPIPQLVLLYDNSKNINKNNYGNLLKFIYDKQNFINQKIPIVWGPGNYKDIKTNIEEHYKKHVLCESEGQYWLQILDGMTYEQYAIDSFYKMSHIIVHSNGKCVYLSGFYGNIFIIGRYDKDVFGISSCYYVPGGEKNGRKNDMCFKIKLKNKI